MKGLTELVFILDRSGSMGGLVDDTIGGFNAMLEKQKKEEGDALVSVVLFDHEQEVIYNRTDIRKVEPLDRDTYYVRGNTALLDAIGNSITHIRKAHKYGRPEDTPEKTLFIITTDGMENSSRKFTYEAVKSLVENEKKEHNWEFLFLGANIDAIDVASHFGIDASRAVNYECDAAGTSLNFKVMSKVVSMARACGSAKEMNACLNDEEPLEEIRQDYKKRHRK